MAIRSRSNSRVSRSCTISRWRRPRKPQRKPKPSAARGLRLVGEGGVVEPELADRGAQILEIGGVDREEAAEDHRLRRPEAGQRLGRRPPVVGDRVADAGVGHLLDRAGEEADLARAELGQSTSFGVKTPTLSTSWAGAGPHHADLHALLEHAVDDAHEHDDAEIGVVPAVDEQRLERRLARRPCGGGSRVTIASSTSVDA